MERVLSPSWQIVCHLSDILRRQLHTLEFLGESIIVIRGKDDQAAPSPMSGRHRGSLSWTAPSGCTKKLVCPYHAWTYELDGRPCRRSREERLPCIRPADHGLTAVEFGGLARLRLRAPEVRRARSKKTSMNGAFSRSGWPPTASRSIEALGRVTLRPRPVNWKNVADNYSDGLHIPIAHPGLTRLFGRGYGIEAEENVDRMWGGLIERPSPNLSERLYQKLLPPVPHLPEEAQRLWLYFKLWPNVAFDIYPDQVDFMQFIPVSPTETLIREISYVLPDDRREMKAARYLNWRINRQVNAEDTLLIARVQAGMQSESFTVGPLSEEEVCLRSFCRKMRRLIPEARLHRVPLPGWSDRSPVAAV
jgi:phenylpropionate dioxygenase-like ring-hydroxylating dioxygenase large terminal subunit